MLPALQNKDFIALIAANMLEIQVEMSVAIQENEAKMKKLETKIAMLLQATSLYEKEDQNQNLMSITFDNNMHPLVNSVKFQNRDQFLIHLKMTLTPSILEHNLRLYFPGWVQILQFIRSAVNLKTKASRDDDILDSSSSIDENGIVKFASMEQEDELKLPLLDTLYGVRKTRTKRKKGFKNKDFKNKPKSRDDDDEIGFKVKPTSRNDDDNDEKDEDEDEDDEADHENLELGELEQDLTDHPLRIEILRFIDVVWTLFDFDVLGFGNYQTVSGMKSTDVQACFADHIYLYLSEDQKAVKFHHEVHHFSKNGPVGEVNLITAKGRLSLNAISFFIFFLILVFFFFSEITTIVQESVKNRKQNVRRRKKREADTQTSGETAIKKRSRSETKEKKLETSVVKNELLYDQPTSGELLYNDNSLSGFGFLHNDNSLSGFGFDFKEEE